MYEETGLHPFKEEVKDRERGPDVKIEGAINKLKGSSTPLIQRIKLIEYPQVIELSNRDIY